MLRSCAALAHLQDDMDMVRTVIKRARPKHEDVPNAPSKPSLKLQVFSGAAIIKNCPVRNPSTTWSY